MTRTIPMDGVYEFKGSLISSFTAPVDGNYTFNGKLLNLKEGDIVNINPDSKDFLKINCFEEE